MKINILPVLILLFLNSLCLYSQTGPGGVGTSANNVLWLKANAGTSSTTNNTRISSWNDQSGNAINVTQTVAVQQPSFATNVINGMPAIQFDNTPTTNDKLIGPDSPSLDNTSGYSFFNVVRPQNVDNNARVIVSKRTTVGVDQSFMLFFFTGSRYYVDLQGTGDRFSAATTYTANNNYILNTFYNGTLAAANRAKSYTGETLEITATETNTLIPNNNSPILIGTTDATDPRPFGGYIAEVIVYTVTVNDAERIIVNNYLSSKYNISLTANDYYVGDIPSNGDFDFDVAGIGAEASGSSNTFSASASAGMGFSSSFGLDNGDYLFAGHATNSNTVNITDVAGIGGDNPGRWERVWYVDVTNSGAPINTTIEFDMVNGGVAPTIPAIAANYKLLYRATNSGAWTIRATANSVSGDKIIFNNYDFNNNAEDGYYTIGTLNHLISPLPIELIDFGAVKNENKVNLFWSTATETNNDYFVVEKSKNGIDFEQVSIVKGAGNSINTIEYADVDYNPYQGISYYRLKQVDFSGKFSYSKIATVNFNLTSSSMTVFPNPTDGPINLALNNLENKEVLIVVRDILGKEFYTKVKIVEDSETIVALDMESKLAPGTYIVIATSDNSLFSQTVIVK